MNTAEKLFAQVAKLTASMNACADAGNETMANAMFVRITQIKRQMREAFGVVVI